MRYEYRQEKVCPWDKLQRIHSLRFSATLARYEMYQCSLISLIQLNTTKLSDLTNRGPSLHRIQPFRSVSRLLRLYEVR